MIFIKNSINFYTLECFPWKGRRIHFNRILPHLTQCYTCLIVHYIFCNGRRDIRKWIFFNKRLLLLKIPSQELEWFVKIIKPIRNQIVGIVFFTCWFHIGRVLFEIKWKCWNLLKVLECSWLVFSRRRNNMKGVYIIIEA